MKAPRIHASRVRFLFVLAILGGLQGFVAHAKLINYVIHVSVDGLRPDAITNLGQANVPNFYRLRTEGAFTDNARTDYDYTETLPNHTTQLTGRGVVGATGHNWDENVDPPDGATLESNKGSYVAGVFDVVHDNGLRTGEYAGKTKFSLHDTSWNAANGAPDGTPPDYGRDKIDIYYYTADSLPLVNRLAGNMSTQALHYAFIHFPEPDIIGHGNGWDPTPGTEYSDAVKAMDIRLGVIFNLIATNAQLTGRTAVILTTDHGGTGTAHANASVAANYTIPFYVWGPGVAAGASLYTLNPTTRLNPGTGRPNYSASPQPVRNGEVANLTLKLLGLPPVPGSTINPAQNLAWSTSTNPAPAAPVATAATSVTNCGFTANWNNVSGATGYLLDVSTNSAFTSFVSGYQDIIVGNVLAYNVTGLRANTTYYYRAWAYNSNGTSGSSGTISATTTANVSAPSVPDASAGTAVVGTSFTANWDIACGATGYRLDVSTSDAFGGFVAGYQNLDVGNVTSRSVTELNGSTTYYYRLRAYNGIGTSGNSDTVSVTTADINFCVPGVSLGHGNMEDANSIEYSVCPDWTSYSAGSGAASWAKEQSIVHGGSAAQRARNINGVAGSLIGVSQTMDANPGDAFTFEGWVYPETTPLYAQAAMATRWDGSTAIPDGTASWKISTGARLVWTHVQAFSGNATGNKVTLFLDSRHKSGSVAITAYWDDVTSRRAYVPPPPTLSSESSTAIAVEVNAGCNSANAAAQFAVSIGGGAYTLGTHWLQANGTIGTTAVWQSDAAWATKTVTGLTAGVPYTFKEQARYSSTYPQPTSFGAGATLTPQAPQTSPPAITQQPANGTTEVGGTTSFTTLASGSNPLSYQWQKNSNNIANGGHYSGCLTNTLTIAGADSNDAANYRCVVTNAYGSTNSINATLTVTNSGTPPIITQSSSNQNVAPGGTCSFTVQASGSLPLSYQWQKNNANLSDGGHYSGSATASLTVTGVDTNDAANYRCVVTNAHGGVTSSNAMLTVSIDCTPNSLVNGDFEGGNTGGVAAGWTGYQRAGTPLPTNVWSIQTAAPTNPPPSTQYQQIANTSSTGGGGVRQDVIRCTVGATYRISGWMRGNSASATCTVKCSPTASTNWSTAINLNPPQTYPGASWTNFSGTVVATGTTMTLWLDGQTGGSGLNKAECFDSVTVSCEGVSAPAPSITQQPGVQNVCAGTTATYSVSASSSEALTYQWQTNGVNLGDNNHYAGCTAATLWVTNVGSGDAANYRCVVSNSGGSTNSSAAVLTLKAATAITGQPSAQNVCPGANATFSVTASGDGILTYQWQTNGVNLSNGSHYGGCTTATLTVTNAGSADAVNYRCVVTGGCGSATSSTPALTLKATTAITQQPTAQGVWPGSNITFSVVATGEGALSYQWQKNQTNLNNGSHYSGVTTAALTISGADLNDVGNYGCVVTGGCGSVSSSNVALGLLAGTIYGTVQLQGFTGVGPRMVQFVAADSAGIGLQTNDASLSFAGSPKVADYVLSVPTNTAWLSAKTGWNLRRRQAVTFISGVATNDFTGTTGQLLGGDISQDNNLVNTADYTVLRGNWLKSTASADLTGDGLVNTADYTILKGNWLKAGDAP